MAEMRKWLSVASSRLAYGAYGLPVFHHLGWLRQTDSWSSEVRAQWRLQRLSTILEFAWNHVPFYREFWGDHGVSYRPLKQAEELRAYPVVTKEIFRANYERFRPDNLKSIRFQEKHSGGTTGEPVHYLQDLDQWAFMQAFHLYGWSLAGYELGDAVGVIAGGSLVPERISPKAKLRSFIERRLFLFGVHMDPGLAREYHERLVEFGAEFLYGYPSVISVFSHHLRQQKLSLPGLRAVITTAEMLQPRYRVTIEKNLGCPVFNNLGCNDGGFESFECKLHRGLHYNDCQSLLEVQDGPAGAPGPLLITNLWNRSTPFIRYANGDLVELGESTCPCGCRFPVISTIEGRTADLLTFSNGRSIAGPALTLIFGEMDIQGWQIVKTQPNTLEVRISCSEEIRESYKAHILRVLGEHLGSTVEVRIKRVDKLTVTRAGKLKPVWSEVPDEMSEASASLSSV
jgi:phenylacetate-CoA ligase